MTSLAVGEPTLACQFGLIRVEGNGFYLAALQQQVQFSSTRFALFLGDDDVRLYR